LAAFEAGEPGFQAFVLWGEPRLRRALMAVYGIDRGLDATAEALAKAWERWETVRTMANPLGYCYRVGQSSTRERKRPVVYSIAEDTEHWVEPLLPSALASLPMRQRVAVVLIHGYGFSVSEVAELIGARPVTVRTHLARGLGRLRRALKADNPKHTAITSNTAPPVRTPTEAERQTIDE
jgi:RNA polymerase sigma factor (sigma-70 family)